MRGVFPFREPDKHLYRPVYGLLRAGRGRRAEDCLGYRFYGFSATSSLEKLKSDGGAVWALLTGGENLLVSPIVDGWKDMLDELREKAARAGAMVRK